MDAEQRRASGSLMVGFSGAGCRVWGLGFGFRDEEQEGVSCAERRTKMHCHHTAEVQVLALHAGYYWGYSVHQYGQVAPRGNTPISDQFPLTLISSVDL